MKNDRENVIFNAMEEIDQAVDVSRNTIKMAIEGNEDNPLSWIMVGLLAQLDIIRESTNKVDDAIDSGEAVLRYE